MWLRAENDERVELHYKCSSSKISGANIIAANKWYSTGRVRRLAERDEVDDAMLHLQHGGGLAVEHRDAVRAPRLVRRQPAAEDHQALAGNTTH